MAISVNGIDTRLVRAEEMKFGGVSKGDDGWLRLTRPLETDLEFAVLKTAQKDHGEGVAGFLSTAFVGNAKTAFGAAETSNEEYSKAATAVLERATGTLAWVATRGGGQRPCSCTTPGSRSLGFVLPMPTVR